ncbi:hypothetical protein [Robiginitalea sp. IMCC43444]|uniref:hypothetical protein n=1 Tax=Robiginitalea sp. IMCC43444 TaxID=3459121 RepID=UPI00404128D9
MNQRILQLFLCLLAVVACKDNPKETEQPPVAEPHMEQPILEKLAEAHGYEKWKDISEIRFTFNVDRGDQHSERSWIWNVKDNRVSLMMNGDTLSYLRSEVDSTLMGADARFINDKYWLLAPYQWVWDQNSFEYTMESKQPAPISGDSLEKLTVVYTGPGGYTPGDAYDFYLDKDSMVREWVFRKGNQKEPSMITTWEGYDDYNGLKISSMHTNAEGSFKLYFTGIQVN